MASDIISRRLKEAAELHAELAALAPQIASAADKIAAALKSGKTLYLFGNGGSAADAQHIAAELQGMFYDRKRRSLAACALTTNTSALTAIGNDLGYEDIFSRQVESLVRKGDVVVAISTSGRSKNVLEGAKAARSLGAYVIGLTGRDGGELSKLCDICLKIPHNDVARIQECHILIGHIVCEFVESSV